MTTDHIFRLDEPEGVFYVRILPAYEDESRVNDGRVTVEIPSLRVSTFVNADRWNGERGLVKVKGKLYSIDDPWSFGAAGHEGDWHSSFRKYSGSGRRTEAGADLGWRSPTRDTLRKLSARVRDRFVADHPEWAKESVRIRLAADLALAIRYADDLRVQAAQHDKIAADLQKRLDALR